jgi:hypothetical protein
VEKQKKKRRVQNKMNFGKIGWGGEAWIDLAQDRDHLWALVYMVKSLRVAGNSGTFLA